MAAENYIRDLSEYLRSGNLSDLTLNFGEKSWQIHKALACSHSKWFRKAMTIGFEETDSGVITLKDDPDFANAIDCMVSYFYEASYNASKHDTSEPLLHAQVAIIADKYDCPSLYELARTSFANTVEAVKSDDWTAVAALVYNHTTPEVLAHVELRSSVVAAVAGRPTVSKAIYQNEGFEELLRSTGDLATDLLLYGLHGSQEKDALKQISRCASCGYTHVGSRDCPNVMSGYANGGWCPQCGRTPKKRKKGLCKPDLFETFACVSCKGFHTAPYPASKSAPEFDPNFGF